MFFILNCFLSLKSFISGLLLCKENANIEKVNFNQNFRLCKTNISTLFNFVYESYSISSNSRTVPVPSYITAWSMALPSERKTNTFINPHTILWFLVVYIRSCLYSTKKCLFFCLHLESCLKLDQILLL